MLLLHLAIRDEAPEQPILDEIASILVPAPEWIRGDEFGLFARSEDRKPKRSSARHQEETLEPERESDFPRLAEPARAPALTAMFRAIITNSRAGGWRKLKRKS